MDWDDLVSEPEPRFRIYLDWYSIWIGFEITSSTVYVNLLPCVVMAFRRRSKPCKPIPCPPFENVTLTQE